MGVNRTSLIDCTAALRRGVAATAWALVFTLSGCSIGPSALERDRLDYQTALADSWKQQILMNLIRVRYGDTPVFLEVTSIIGQYSAEAHVNAEATLNGPTWSHSQTYGGSGTIYDRPTITFVPLTGEKFSRSLFTPLPPVTLVALIQSGYPVDAILRLTCSSINGVHNASRGPATSRPEDPEFSELLAALRRIQLDDGIAVRVEKKGAAEAATIRIGNAPSPQSETDAKRVRELLGLDPTAREFRLVYGSNSTGAAELALLTRSVSQLMVELAACIEVPTKHVVEGKTYPTLANGGASFIRVRSSTIRPPGAFAAIRYRGCWFSVDDGDFVSKRMLSLMMLFFSLTETGGGTGAPVVTVNAG